METKYHSDDGGIEGKMKQYKDKKNGGKRMKGSWPSSVTPSGRRMRKLALLPTLIALAVIASHSRCHVVDASTREEQQRENDGDLIVLDDHDTSVVEFGGGSTRPRRFVEDPEDEEGENIHYDTSDENQSSREKNGSKVIDNLIVVVSVDGTLAGICKETGKVLWKQTRQEMETQQTHQNTMKPTKSKPDTPQARLLQPLVSTTTTTKSASTSEYAAVPSVDGSVYLTSSDITVTTSIKELVSRAPFLDSKGRFYVGSHFATAAALDGETGEILRILSASDVTSEDDDQISLEGRNAIWVGRIDYSVSVQDARTGIVDAQFSVADVMSVSDMQGSRGLAAWNSEKQPGPRQSASSDNAFTARLRQLPAPNEGSTLAASDGRPSALVATPSGNLAYRDAGTGELQWVADSSFDSPIAFAMDASSGYSLGVDIIPDVPIPDSSIEYLSREIERQLELIQEQHLEKNDQTIVGAMTNGQLYALPLGGRPSSTASPTLPQQQHASVAAHAAVHSPKVPQITGGRTNFHTHSHDGKQNLATKKHCDPLSSQFPGCLIGSTAVSQHHHHHHHLIDYHPAVAHGNSFLDSGANRALDDGENLGKDGLAVAVGHVAAEGGFYHPDLGFVSAQDLQRIQQRMQPPSNKRTLMRIMSSWLPPTIALIFVLSFELGRRKRLKDNQKAAEEQIEKPLKVEESNRNVDHEVVPLQRTQQYVIQVSDEVLGYGGQGTVVYRGMLDGRSVAVKRLLSAYHASAEREIKLLIESDGHPNVVRYFLKEARGDFVYLALELCSLSLHDLIGVLRQNDELTPCGQVQPKVYESSKTILLQIASGVKHLHALRIVHRDLKPGESAKRPCHRKLYFVFLFSQPAFPSSQYFTCDL